MSRRLALFILSLLALLPVLHAASPRWVTSRPPWDNDGDAVVWYRNDVSYFVDAGALSSSVSNSAATQIVNAAASVWNIQYSNLVLSNGGSLNEDVSSANVYLGSSGPIWPADVDSANYTSKQIAVVFDADGTLIDMVLGSGASAPASCRQNAAVENVDKFIQPGAIAHAVILLNGRCTGPAPEQQLQMQYQLMRVFGRAIGLSWSQVNDNVFTGAPAPTYQQQLHWPIMHPIDIVCGTYTYQCLPSPFTLRDDDRCAVRLLYGVSAYTVTDGSALNGNLLFPTGQGMDGVNMVAVRQSVQGQYGTEPWETTSAVTGYLYRRSIGNPVAGMLSTFPALQGTWYPPKQGFWTMAGVPVIGDDPWDNVFVTPQAINPLYRGAYAIGPSGTGAIVPSGEAVVTTFSVMGRSGGADAYTMPSSAANDCTTGNDGTESSPAPVAYGGTWSGKLCAYSHYSWGSFDVQAGRSATLEIMALDENGAATNGKAHPVLGIWHGTDATGTLPTVATASIPFNGRQVGTTQLKASFSTSETVRFVVADERSNGRPDFAYSARLLYASTVTPSRLGDAGGVVRIAGTGFQPGNTVTVGGVASTVVSISATEIVAQAPTITALSGRTSNDVTITDLRTGGTTTIVAGLLYGSSTGDVLTVQQAPPANVDVGVPAVFQVRLTNSTGAAVSGVTVNFSVTAGAATLAPCGGATCSVATDNTGLATVQASATAAGTISLRAATNSGAQALAQFTAVAKSQSVSAVRGTEYVAASVNAPLQPAVVLVNNQRRATATPVQWSVISGGVVFTTSSSASGSDGVAVAGAKANLQGGDQAVVQGCAWTNVCASMTLVGVSTDRLQLQGVSGDAQVVSAGSRLGTLVLRVTDGAGNGVAGATVSLYQTVTAWQPACPATGRCPVAPVYGSSKTTLVSDDDGLLSLTPLQYDGTAADTRIVAATGSSGYIALTLKKQP